MCRMHLDYLEPRSEGALGSVDERLDNALDLPFTQLSGGRVFRVEGNFRRPDRHPAAVTDRYAAMFAQPGPIGAGLASGVGQLNARH
ncbi:hypothetical protein D9M71_603820 [compost metagenome]